MQIDIDSTLDDRATAPITFEAVSTLVDWYADHPPTFSPIELGWDLRRTLGDEGFDIWRELMFDHDEPARPEYINETWASFDRPGPTQFDRLVFDEIGWARRDGFQPPADIEAIFATLAEELVEHASIDVKLARFRDRLGIEAEQAAMRSAGVSMPAQLSVLPATPQPDLIQSSAQFVQGFTPPDYLVDDILQRRFCYSLTAQTGVGKTAVAMLIAANVSIGRAIGAHEIAKGSVLYFAGENPTDIQMRWLGLTRELGIDPAGADVHFIAGAMPLSQVAERISAEVARKGLTLALVVVDTAAAYFEGDDENSNTQAVDHAKRMRSLTLLPGGPCVVILCHPTKRAADDDLIPRGGGAFLAEVDGNIALRKRDDTLVANVQGKFRGSDAWSLVFGIKAVQHPALKDSKRRDIWTVVAQPLTEAGKQVAETANRRHEDMLLRAIEKHPGASLRELATALAWMDGKGAPAAMKVSRAASTLEKEKLLRKHRGAWQLTAAGEKELNRLDLASGAKRDYALTPVTPAPPLPPFAKS